MKKRKYIKNSIKVEKLCKNYTNGKNIKRKVFDNFNISFEKEKIHCILGVSGCGKSTLLRIIAGLEEYESGRVIFSSVLFK